MVVVVAKGGLPVTEVTSGGLAIPDNGVGIAVTKVAKGGLAVVFVKQAPPEVPQLPPYTLTSISPTSMPANTQTTLRAFGRDFQSTSRIEVGGTLHSTTFVNAGELTASIKKPAGTLPVKVRTGTDYTNAIDLIVT